MHEIPPGQGLSHEVRIGGGEFRSMGKPTGFIEYLRELPLDRTAVERIRDWNEFHQHMEQGKLREQAARCMDCGIPFCHTGQLVSGMASGCPIHNLIPEWNDLVYRGLWKEALERLHSTATVLGMFEEWRCDVAETCVGPNDILAICTDGVLEAANAAGEEFGEDGLVAALRAGRGQKAELLLESVIAAVKK